MRAAGIECIKAGTKREHACEAAVETHHRIPDTLDELLTLERQVEREWWWLHGQSAPWRSYRLSDRSAT